MIRFYDFEFNLLCAEPRVISSRWRIYYNDIGTFEAQFSKDSEVASVISENRYVVACEDGKCAVIVAHELGDTLSVYGRSCNWLLKKKIVASVEKQTVTPASLCRKLVLEKFSDVPNFEAEEYSGGALSEFEKISPDELFGIVKECLDKDKLGHTLDFDIGNKCWRFKILEGKENSLIISEGNKNAYDTKLEEDILDLAVCGYYEDEDGQIQCYTVSELAGIYCWETVISASCQSEASAVMDKNVQKSSITAKTKDIYLGNGYNLGDILRIQIIKGSLKATKKVRIAGEEVHFADGVISRQPIFENI